MQCMEMKLGMHMYLNVSMTTTNKRLPQALFPITTSSLLKLANHAIHGAETWYVCVFRRFHDNHEQKNGLGHFDQKRILHFSNLQTKKCVEVKLFQHEHFSVCMTTINEKWPWALFSIHLSNLQTIQCMKAKLISVFP